MPKPSESLPMPSVSDAAVTAPAATASVVKFIVQFQLRLENIDRKLSNLKISSFLLSA